MLLFRQVTTRFMTILKSHVIVVRLVTRLTSHLPSLQPHSHQISSWRHLFLITQICQRNTSGTPNYNKTNFLHFEHRNVIAWHYCYSAMLIILINATHGCALYYLYHVCPIGILLMIHFVHILLTGNIEMPYYFGSQLGLILRIWWLFQ